MKKRILFLVVMAALAFNCTKPEPLPGGDDTENPGGEDTENPGGDDKPEDGVTTLAALGSMAKATEATFDVTVKNVVVSCVYNNYAYLEDASGAILVYMKNHGLSEGELINGNISGTFKLYNGKYSDVLEGEMSYPEITALDLSKATVSSGATIPCTEVTLDQLNKNIEAWCSRRVIIKGITVKQGVSSSSKEGSIMQGNQSFLIYNKSGKVSLKDGLYGDIIGFPTVYYANTVCKLQLYLFDNNQFTEGEPLPEPAPEESAFTALTAYGIYGNTDSDAPVAELTYLEGSDQFAAGTKASSRHFNLIRLSENIAHNFTVDASSFTTGSQYNVTYTQTGKSAVKKTMTLVQKSKAKLWFEDKTGHIGYIIGIE